MRSDKRLDRLDKIDDNLPKVVAKLKQRKVNIEVKPLVDYKANQAVEPEVR